MRIKICEAGKLWLILQTITNFSDIDGCLIQAPAFAPKDLWQDSV